jgi:hypothetical protein
MGDHRNSRIQTTKAIAFFYALLHEVTRSFCENESGAENEKKLNLL